MLALLVFNPSIPPYPNRFQMRPVFPSVPPIADTDRYRAMVFGRALLLLALLGASSAYSLTSASLSRTQQHRLPRRCASLSLPTLSPHVHTCTHTHSPDAHLPTAAEP